MSYFYSQSFNQIRNSSGKKYTKFQIVKGNDGSINQIKGTSTNGDLYHIQHNTKHRNSKTGIVHSQHRVYKIKSSDLKNILKESQKKPNNVKVITLKDKPKKVKSLKSTKVVKVSEPKKVKKSKSTTTLKKKSEKKEKKVKSEKKMKSEKKVKSDKKTVIKKVKNNNEK